MTRPLPRVNNPASGPPTFETIPHTTSTELTASDSGKLHTNTGAVGPITLTIPNAADGINLRFFTTVDQIIKIKPKAGEAIIWSGGTMADAESLNISDIGSSAELIAEGSGYRLINSEGNIVEDSA